MPLHLVWMDSKPSLSSVQSEAPFLFTSLLKRTCGKHGLAHILTKYCRCMPLSWNRRCSKHVLTARYQPHRVEKCQKMFNSSIQLYLPDRWSRFLTTHDGDRPTDHHSSSKFWDLLWSRTNTEEYASRRSCSERQPSALITVACPPARAA